MWGRNDAFPALDRASSPRRRRIPDSELPVGSLSLGCPGGITRPIELRRPETFQEPPPFKILGLGLFRIRLSHTHPPGVHIPYSPINTNSFIHSPFAFTSPKVPSTSPPSRKDKQIKDKPTNYKPRGAMDRIMRTLPTLHVHTHSSPSVWPRILRYFPTPVPGQRFHRFPQSHRAAHPSLLVITH